MARNSIWLFRSPLDKLVEALPLEVRRQIVLDFDELERTGVNGDTALRHHAGDIYRKMQGKSSGFDAAYMMFVAYSVHKIASAQAIEAEQGIGLTDEVTADQAVTAGCITGNGYPPVEEWPVEELRDGGWS